MANCSMKSVAFWCAEYSDRSVSELALRSSSSSGAAAGPWPSRDLQHAPR